MAHFRFLGIGDELVLQRTIVLEPVHPFARTVFAVAHRYVERPIAAHHHAAVHIDHFLLGHAEIGSDLVHILGMEIGVLVSVEILLHPAQVEEQLLLRGGGAHFDEAPRAQDIFLDARLDPPHGIGREAEAAIGLELLDALHQADIAFGDEIRHRQAVTAVAHGDFRHQPQVRGDELRRSFGIVMFLIALREHVFLLLRQHREFLDFGKITVEALLAAECRDTQRFGIAHLYPDLSCVDLARRTPDGHPTFGPLGLRIADTAQIAHAFHRFQRAVSSMSSRISVGSSARKSKVSALIGWLKPSRAACSAWRWNPSDSSTCRKGLGVRPYTGSPNSA